VNAQRARSHTKKKSLRIKTKRPSSNVGFLFPLAWPAGRPAGPRGDLSAVAGRGRGPCPRLTVNNAPGAILHLVLVVLLVVATCEANLSPDLTFFCPGSRREERPRPSTVTPSVRQSVTLCDRPSLVQTPDASPSRQDDVAVTAKSVSKTSLVCKKKKKKGFVLSRSLFVSFARLPVDSRGRADRTDRPWRTCGRPSGRRCT